MQFVIRPQRGTDHDLHDYRGYAGTVAGGIFKPGDEVVVLPSGFTSRIAEVRAPGGEPLEEAFPPQSVTLRLTEDLDISRGDMICRAHNRPYVGQDIDAMVCWFSDQSALAVRGPVPDPADHPIGGGPGRGPRLPPGCQHPPPR